MKEFILQSLTYSGLLYLSYLLLFRRMSFFRINRVLLLAIPFVSLLIPAFAPRFNSPLPSTVPNFSLPDIQIGPQAVQAVDSASQDINCLVAVYLIGAGIFLMLMIAGLLKAYRLVRDAQPWHHPILISEKAAGPFAFFHKIIIPSHLQSSRQLDSIIRHEQTHLSKGHSYDNAFYGLLCCLLWFNPFFHLLFRELRQVHECQADQNALADSDRESYARLLLSSAMGGEINSLAASPFFNTSLIKTRITMLYKTKTNRKMKGLYLILLPVILTMSVWSCQKNEPQTVAPAEEKAQIIGFAEADQPPLFPDCDPAAAKEEQLDCFQQGIMNHVMSNFKYPPMAENEGLEGKIFVEFTIDRAGKVNDTKVVRWKFTNDGVTTRTQTEDYETAETRYGVKLEPAAQEALDQAIKLVEALPELTPAQKDSKETAVKFTLPLTLKLQ